MLPVDWAAAVLLLAVASTCVCAVGQPRYVAVWPQITFVTAVAAAYLMWRILRQEQVRMHVRLQLLTAALVTLAATLGASAIYFHPRYKAWYRPYPPSLYGWLAAVGTGIAWFAAGKVV